MKFLELHWKDGAVVLVNVAQIASIQDAGGDARLVMTAGDDIWTRESFDELRHLVDLAN